MTAVKTRGSIFCYRLIIRGPLFLPVADWPTGDFPNLERPYDPANIMGMEPIRGNWVHFGEAMMQRLIAIALPFLSEPLTQLGIGGRAIKQAPQQCFQVKRCPADQQDSLAPAFDFLATLFGLLQPPGDAGRFPRIQNID